MIYSPVIIPTLNRFDHLKQCVESLSCCHNADKTEVFISVDYPPSERYKEGHDRICEYLKNSSLNFKELHVYKQTTNLGVIDNGLKKCDNITFLVEEVCKKFDRWILSEDDNLFAPGFLDFMNVSLERFKDDKTVFSVCGYRFYYNIKYKSNNFFRQNTDFNAWGCGFWIEKYREANKLEVDYLKRMMLNPFKIWKLWHVSNNRITTLCGLSMKKNFKKADNFYTLYMIDKGMFQIMPTKSLVKNIGWDDSGIHCSGFDKQIVEDHMNQEIDESPVFESLRGTGWEFFKYNQRVIRDEDFQKIPFKTAFISYLYRLIHINM